jgi:hypothetical protein
MSMVFETSMQQTKTAQENWLRSNQQSIRNLDRNNNKINSSINQHIEEVANRQVVTPSSQAIQKRVMFLKQFNNNSCPVNSSQTGNCTSNTTTPVDNLKILQEQQETGIGLDAICKMLFTTMEQLPQNVAYEKVTDIDKGEIRTQGVRMLTNKFSPYRNISKEVRLCTNIHNGDSDEAVEDIKNCCKDVYERSVFPHTQTNYTIKKNNTVKEIKKVDIVKVCQNIPVCYSPSFQMDDKTSKQLKDAIFFAEDIKNLKVFQVDGVPTPMYEDSIILTPRHVGGNLIYTTSLFTDMSDKEIKDKHSMQSMTTKSKHPRFGISLAHHMDSIVAQVHDKARYNLDNWLYSACDNDIDTYKTITANNHKPTVKISNTEHCAYVSPCHGITVLLQHNKFDVSSSALARYGLSTNSLNTMKITAISIMFHGPIIHKV